ncbi:MAG: hypothetical protein PWQ09_58 [Candidatus Cloacimonadota bacterium]|jgi:hypothetical protein|nr:hypothetical protein [Candidatus Cloacimonadota bacterium]
MKKILVIILTVLLTSLLVADKYAGEIFKMGSGVRNSALGNCGLTDINSAHLAYWNPALLALEPARKLELMHAEEYSGLLKYDLFSAVLGKKQRLSFTIARIGIDDIPLTKLEDPNNSVNYDNRPYEYKSVNNSDMVFYFGFARKIGNYYLGLTPKIAYRKLADENGFGFGADISTFLSINKKLMVAANLRDFFSTQILWSNGSHEFVNPNLQLEAQYSLLLPLINKNGKLYFGTDIYAENRDFAATTDISIFSLDYHAGLEMNILQNFDLLLGYDVDNLTAGMSFGYKKWQFNYAFEQNTELENSHRISVGFNL